jgi:DNA-binding transcriptional LysR family regulator
MRFRQLEYFIAAAEELNFNRAADRLQVFRTTFKTQINELEGELTIDLLRGGREASH